MELLTLGWREWLALPDLGIGAIKAKIDTGARSSALHVEAQEVFRRDGDEWVRFEIAPTYRHAPHVVCEAPVVAVRPVTDSGGHTTERRFIRTVLEVAGQRWSIDINLTNRTHMLFPMLLGRTAMAGRLRVEPARSYTLGSPGKHP
ncbi:MAG TPA: RimK/LysX family protein [Xanthomonadaceae bacterium]|nr:RimK/LysX family protein [Xanthomonadaceae bacterium]